MTRKMGRLAVGLTSGLVMGVFALGCVVGAMDARAEPSAADVQWAQQTLKARGYDIGGRVSAKMTPPAQAALSKFQRDQGLPATGALDQATLDALIATKTKAPTMGVLGQTKSSGAPGGGSGGSSDGPPRPKAAPTERVGGSGDGDRPMSSVTLGAPNVNASGGPRVTAAPAPSVSTTAPADEGDGVNAAPRARVIGGDVTSPVGATGGAPSLTDWSAANWMRYGLWGAMGALALGMLGAWWRGGRRKLPVTGYDLSDDDRPPTFGRVEPSFERGGGAKVARPVLTAPARPRR